MTEVAAFIVVGSSLLMVLLMFRMQSQNNRLWRDTVIYLRSKTAYEAEDAIDRQEQRGKSIMAKQVDKMRKEKENLRSEDPLTPEEELARDIGKAYGKDKNATKPLI